MTNYYTTANRHTAAALTSSGMTIVKVSSQRLYDVIPVRDTGIQKT
ncbi:MAG: hypothetical protein ACR5LA_08925 [Wolbachia sp.]